MYLNKLKPSFQEMLNKITNVTIDDIKNIQYLVENKNIKEAMKNENFKNITRCLKFVSHSVKGTPQHKLEQLKISLGIIQSVGFQNFFYTVNFDDIHDPIVAILAGYKIILNENNEIDNLKLDIQKEIAANDSVAVADFVFIKTLIMFKDLFGFDIINKKTINGGGLCGYLESITSGLYDNQGRGGLHLHFNAKIVGFPTANELFEKLQNSKYQNRYILMVDSIFSTSPKTWNENEIKTNKNKVKFQIPPKIPINIEKMENSEYYKLHKEFQNNLTSRIMVLII